MKLTLFASRASLRSLVVFRFFTFSMLCLSSSFALAAHDWNLVEETDSVLQIPVCRATTAVVKAPTSATTPAEISFAFAKDKSLLPIVYVKIHGLAVKAPYALIRFSKKVFQPMFLLKAGQTADEADIYWYAPASLPKLLDLVKSASTLDIVFDPKETAPSPVRFSLAGAESALGKTAKCVGTRDLLPNDFLTALNLRSPYTGELPATITAQDLLDLTQKAFRDFNDGKTQSAALAVLHKAMKPLTDKEAAALKVLSGKQSVLDKTTQDFNNRTNDLANLQTQLTQFNADLVQLQAGKIAADADYAGKKAIYDPAKAQITPLERAVDNRSNTLGNVRRALAAQRSRISDDQNSIAQLQSESNNLRSQISSLDGSISSAQSTYQRAQSDLNGYNVNWERQRLLSSNGQYSNCQREIPNQRRACADFQNQARQAQNELANAQSDLSRCQTGHPECPRKQQAVNEAQARVNDFQNRASQAESQANQLENQLRSIESDAARQAESKQSDLQSVRDRAYNQLSDLQTNRNNDVRRVNDIEGSEILSLRNDIASAKSSAATLDRQREQVEGDLADAKAALATTHAQIGFDLIEKNYFDSKTLVAKMADDIAKKTSAIDKTTQSIAKLPPVIAKLHNTAAHQTVDRDAAQTVVSGIQAALAPQRAQEAALQATLDNTKTSLADGRARYQAELIKLSEGI